ncbi:hypothetical protein CY34DRAFT_108147 [Suillus luteus UH-Slu-Lm8-n1]|uniref:Uncharacterized protein n=1 Tax=Suillus luteus UH-Slu-Lm8-n1 TaxID=930992 RepID=A0A0D0ANM1_9AGAM|nr:hypothetical protein CY34DRAFT_108147 [Suillus luteus UH-Slu-Lm8-n1]
MASSWSTPTKRPKPDKVTKLHGYTNVILDYCLSYLMYGSDTDGVQRSSLKEMNDALLVNTHLTYEERLVKARTYNHQAQFLSTKLQILFNRENRSDYNVWALRYGVLHEQGYGARTAAADEAALVDPHLVTIDPKTFVISRRPSIFK